MARPKRRLDSSARSGVARRDGTRPAGTRSLPEIDARPRTKKPEIRYNRSYLEVAAWLVVAAVALGIRLINVDGNPLQSTESALAMDSWRIVHHEGVQIGPSPLFIYLNALLFLMLGATDAVARSASVIAGAAVAMSPLLLRHRLGRIGSLVAATICATSPTLVFASRSVDPTMLSLGLGLGLILLGERYLRLGRVSYLYLGAVLTALLLMSGPLAYHLAIVLVGFAVVYGSEGVQNTFNPSGKSSLRRERDGMPSPIGQAGSGAIDRSDLYDPPNGDGTVGAWKVWLPLPTEAKGDVEMTGVLKRAVSLFLLTTAVVGTGLATNIEGLGESLSLPLSQWAASFSGFAAHPAWLYPALMLGYEPAALILGIAGAAVAFRRGQAFEMLLAWWACVGFLLLVLGDGADPSWNALIVIPLAMLAGIALDGLPATFVDAEQFRRLAIYSAVVFPLIATTFIAFGHVTLPNPIIPREVALAPPLALLAFAASFAFGYDWRTTFRTSAAVAAICLIAFNVHGAMLLNPGGELNPGELFTGSVTSADVRRMAADVSMTLDELQIARQIEGRSVTQQVEVSSAFANPVLWYLKDQPDVRVVTSISDAPAVAIVGVNDKAPRGPYAGEVFQFSVSEPRPRLTFGDLWRWWMYHESAGRTSTYVKVWVKTQLSPAGQRG
jgi:uncharacterized protein (TIGR03663 family)